MNRTMGKVVAGAAWVLRQRIRALRFSIFRGAIATDTEGPTLLLAALERRFYNTQIAASILAGSQMDKFEEFGRRIDEELTRLRRYIENEVAPETERRSAEFLREISAKLNQAAEKLEARQAARRNSSSQSPPS
jgi:hypothetical protein